MAPKIALYGRTYWDVQVRVSLDAIAGAKSKVDAPVEVTPGGFACNAARAIAARFPSGAIRVVTVTSAHDRARLRPLLPARIGLEALLTKDPRALPPFTVILDPAGACRIFRDRFDEDAKEWKPARVSRATLGAKLHVAGRLPLPFVREIQRRARKQGGRFAWVGGAALPLALERECDVVCVNRKEARELLGSSSDDTGELAEALAARARVPGSVRIVTGGSTPTTAAIRGGGEVRSHRAANVDVPREKIRRLLGVGDAFAAHFLAEACFDATGAPREELEIERALDAAQKAAARFIQS